VYQGERDIAAHNKLLGQFTIGGLPPAPKGGVKIDVSFDIDANGIMNVTASDQATGKSKSVVVQSSGGLSDNEVERMVAEAERMREEDQKRMQAIEAKNAAETLSNQVEQQLDDFKDKLSVDDKEDLKKKMASLREAIESSDLEQMQERTKVLQEASWKATQSAYGNSESSGGEEKKDDK